jgi:NTP pyrophosphatase (non-canonical NTP hydrolase)
MSLKSYQKQVDEWVQDYKVPYWSPLSQIASLVEEVGELSRIYNHKYGDKVKKATEEEDDLEGELADVLFGVLCMANQEGIDLDKALTKMLNKVRIRDADRFEKK